MEIKTSELGGAALDWAVAESVGIKDLSWEWNPHTKRMMVTHENEMHSFIPSTDWAQCGPLIQEFKMNIFQAGEAPDVCARIGQDITKRGLGETPLVAACRAIVQHKLGDTVTIPNELEG